ncbi:hypothetical protein [Paenibacillus sinopodophylli]|uniref:hypothetical protein n=1 Tax=Paenibacillus sinopodophylli TaxID=1837342 RepID=UPI00110CADC3|nr:hypothetical protein [Paenibacillus sinopodophylli]
MNQRLLKKKRKKAAQQAAPEITVQQAFNKLAEYLGSRAETVCYFIDTGGFGGSPINLHNAGSSLVIRQGGNFHPGGEL